MQINQGLEEWWSVDCVFKLKPIFKTVPAFIIWEIWKRRNVLIHGRMMSRQSMMAEINKNLYLFTKCRYPWLKGIPNNWPPIVKYMEEYVPLVRNKMVEWNHAPSESFKCNTDRSCRGNPGPRSMVFCVRNEFGDLVCVESRLLERCIVIESDIKAIRIGFVYCQQHNLLPLIVETNSLIAETVKNGVWEVPWSISLDIRHVHGIIHSCQVHKSNNSKTTKTFHNKQSQSFI
ncbi:hypothetical protein H5410_061093 [Solanum commersonii]|uniref:RNase H type-1 domain-containing protein n=1 Tax=Solanum commersonii TaxID=4109 RepID=A0A9J5W7M0_SOLCO|nr:hypothetical protein H5410_061093 [Solanum commersonii]